MNLVALLFNKWTWIALLIGAFSLTIGIQRVALKHKDSVIEEKDKTIGSMRADAAEKDGLIASQNLAVEGWKAAGLKHDQLRREAEKRALALSRQADASPVPTAPIQVQACAERDTWLRNQLNSLLLH
jgi:hypothetical protein